jgi:hypothetical protein
VWVWVWVGVGVRARVRDRVRVRQYAPLGRRRSPLEGGRHTPPSGSHETVNEIVPVGGGTALPICCTESLRRPAALRARSVAPSPGKSFG